MRDCHDRTDSRWPTLLAAAGSAVTTFLLVAVAGIEFLAIEFSALVALPVGVLAGLAVFAAVTLTADGLSPPVRRLLVAYAAFGPGVLSMLGLAYVNVARDLLSVRVATGIGLVAAVAAYAAARTGER